MRGATGLAEQGPRLWIFSELYYPEEVSTGYYVTRIAEGLASTSRVAVLCAQPTYSLRGHRAPAREVLRGVEVRRVWSTTWPNERMAARLANLMTLTGSLFLQALFRLRRGELALVVTTPPSLPFAVGLACLLKRCRCVVFVQDSYPEVLVAAGILRAGSLPARLMNRANRWLYRRATRIVVVGRGIQDRVRGKLSAAEQPKVRVIRDWTDIDLIRPLPRDDSPLLRELGLLDKVVVQYAGNISRLNGLENLAATIDLLADDDRIHFLFVGRGGRRPWLEEQLRERRWRNVTLRDWMPREETPEMHRACDVALVPLIAGMAGVSVPSRLYSSLASGRPIVAVTEPASELARVVEEEDVGWVVPPDEPEALARALREAAQDRARRDEMGVRARRAAESRFASRQSIAEWVRLVEELREA